MTDVKTRSMDELVLRRLQESEGHAISASTGKGFRVSVVKALGIDAMHADDVHSSMVRLVQRGLVEKTLVGEQVTHVRYRRVA